MSSESRRISSLVSRGAALLSASFLLLGGLLLIWLWDVQSVRHLAANLLGSYLLLWAVVFLIFGGSNTELQLGFALSSISFGLVLMVLEALSFMGLVDYRLLFGVGTSPGDPLWFNPKNLFDEELLVVRQPHLHMSGTKQGNISRILCLSGFPPYPYDVRYDHNGFRNNHDLAEAKIAVLGDSYIEGVKIPYDETLSQHLARLSEATVANLGLSSYGPQQMQTVLRRFALPLRPEVIVWAFFEGNDLKDIDRYDRQVTQLQRGLLRTSPTTRDRYFTKTALHALYGRLDKCKQSSEAQRHVGVYRARDGRELQMYFWAGTRPLGPEELSGLPRLKDILARAHVLAAGSGAKLVLLYIPTKYRVHRKFVEAPAFSEVGEWGVSDLPSRLQALVRDVSPEIAFLDLTPSLVSAATDGELVYFLDDTHWTPAGHRVAAEAIWRFLSDRDRRPSEIP